MTTFEFSDDFDAVGFFLEHPNAIEDDGYGWDEYAEYPF